MKKILLIAINFSLLTPLMAQVEMTNGGFNTWENSKLYEKPDHWFHAYDERPFQNTNPLLFEKSTTASDLNSAIRLNTISNSQDTSSGFILLGSIPSTGDGMPIGGVPFTLAADSLIFDAQYNLLGTDSANVLVMLKSGGTPFYTEILKIGGSQNSWKRMAFAINPDQQVPDSLILGFVCSQIGEQESSTPGSWITIDNIQFAVGSSISSPIPNPSFEDWTDYTTETIAGWSAMAPLESTGGKFVTKTSSAQEGEFAVEINTLSFHESEIIPGSLYFGKFDFDDKPYKGEPFTSSPTALTGYYKFSPDGTDTASIMVSFRNSGVEVPFYSNALMFDEAKSEYTAFSIPIDLTTAPDTVMIMLINGKNVNTKVTFDNLKFTGGNVSEKELHFNENTLSIYPNPSQGSANLKLGLLKANNVSYHIINAFGQEVVNRNLGVLKDGVHTISLSNLNSGIYFVETWIGDESYIQKFIVK